MALNKGLSRRSIFLLALASIIVFVTFLTSLGSTRGKIKHPVFSKQLAVSGKSSIPNYATHGGAIAPKLVNETAKVELGRAAWRVLHTTFARFPEKPTKDERAALESYVYLFQRLYPCGECASHFGDLLKKFPPQVSNRNIATGWGCHIHNEVNKFLQKPLFDCTKIGDFYDCGCGDSTTSDVEAEEAAPSRSGDEQKAIEDEDFDQDKLDASLVKLEREEYQRGG